jgi:putative addiction module component (TIGR02574 family)
MASSAMIAEQYPGLLDLPDDEKLQLAGELWHAVIGDAAGDDPALASFIEARLADYQAHPDSVTAWGEVKARLLALRR